MSAENLFSNPLKVINVGLQSFAQDLRAVGVECQHVDPDRRSVDGDTSPAPEPGPVAGKE
jgi:hypothetical protein